MSESFQVGMTQLLPAAEPETGPCPSWCRCRAEHPALSDAIDRAAMRQMVMWLDPDPAPSRPRPRHLQAVGGAR